MGEADWLPSANLPDMLALLRGMGWSREKGHDMTETEWLNIQAPQAMLAFLRDSGRLSERKARLFAVACCRRIWSLLGDERSRKAVEMAEQYADGLVDAEEPAMARAGAGAVVDVLFPAPLTLSVGRTIR